MRKNPNLLPIVHISAHGDENGIQLSDGTEISWKNMRTVLLPINKALKGLLLLCMSACKGFAACVMAMEAGELPFMAVIGTHETPTWSDTLARISHR